jgi:hypothetical protein
MRNRGRLRAILFMPLGVILFAVGWLMCSAPSRSCAIKRKNNNPLRNNDDAIKFELIAREEDQEITWVDHK